MTDLKSAIYKDFSDFRLNMQELMFLMGPKPIKHRFLHI